MKISKSIRKTTQVVILQKALFKILKQHTGFEADASCLTALEKAYVGMDDNNFPSLYIVIEETRRDDTTRI